MRFPTAPVKAPRTWPKSSASSSASGMALQLSATNWCARRVLLWWIARATTSLPVPVSPVIRMVLLVAATVSSSLNRRAIGAALADDRVEAITLVELGAQVGVLGLQSPLFERGVQRVQQFVDLKGFGDEIRRAALDRFDRMFDRAISRHDDRDDIRVALACRVDDCRAIDSGQSQVGDEYIERKVR